MSYQFVFIFVTKVWLVKLSSFRTFWSDIVVFRSFGILVNFEIKFSLVTATRLLIMVHWLCYHWWMLNWMRWDWNRVLWSWRLLFCLLVCLNILHLICFKLDLCLWFSIQLDALREQWWGVSLDLRIEVYLVLWHLLHHRLHSCFLYSRYF